MSRSDLSDLTAFVAIADNLSFRAAAARLGVTPSALSHTMRQLEESLGVRLLHRTTRSVSVTDAGLRLLARLRPGINQIASALEDLNEERQRPLGRLRIYANHLAAAAVIAKAAVRQPKSIGYCIWYPLVIRKRAATVHIQHGNTSDRGTIGWLCDGNDTMHGEKAL